MAIAWAVTLPAAALVGGIVDGGASLIGGDAGVYVMAVLAISFAVLIFSLSRRRPINADNVAEDFDNPLDKALTSVGGYEMPAVATVTRKKKRRSRDG